MTVDDISKCAAQDVLPLGDLTVAERLLWYELRDIYRGFKSGEVTQDYGQKKKTECLVQFERNNKDAEMTSKIIKANAGMWMRIEQKAREYKENKTIENADAFMEAVYGVTFKAALNDEKNADSTFDSAPTAQTTKTE